MTYRALPNVPHGARLAAGEAINDTLARTGNGGAATNAGWGAARSYLAEHGRAGEFSDAQLRAVASHMYDSVRAGQALEQLYAIGDGELSSYPTSDLSPPGWRARIEYEAVIDPRLPPRRIYLVAEGLGTPSVAELRNQIEDLAAELAANYGAQGFTPWPATNIRIYGVEGG